MNTHKFLALLIVSLFVFLLTESFTVASTFVSTKTESAIAVHLDTPDSKDDAKKPRKGKSRHNLNASDGYDAAKAKQRTADAASHSPKNFRDHNL